MTLNENTDLRYEGSESAERRGQSEGKALEG